MPRFTSHPDGSFDIAAGPVVLRGCYPAIDHLALRPLQVATERQDGRELIVYDLAGGVRLELTVAITADGIALDTVLTGLDVAPHWVHPLASAHLAGVARFFRTGLGFSGPTNFVDLTTQKDHFAFESYLFTGLAAADRTTLTVAVREVDDFQQKCHVENRLHRGQFRNRDVVRNEPYFEAGFSCECIPLPSRSVRLPTLHISAAGDSWTALRAAATATARAAGGRVQAPTYHYCSFFRRGEHYTQRDLADFLAGLARQPEPLSYVQVDGGYCPFWSDWLDPHPSRYPDGIEKAMKSIVALGYVPGIWIGPFMVSNCSRIASEHPEWLLRWNDGRLVTEWKLYNNLREDQECYVLDTSHPAAMAFLAHVFRTMRSWGVRFYKTDFLEWGYRDSTLVRRHAPGKTATQYFRDTLRTIRAAIGEDSYWLGCITYFAPCVGFMDGMRVGSDVGVGWNDGPGGIGNDGCGGGTQNSVEESYGCQFFNNLLWQNDPDVTFFRDYFVELDDGEIHALAYYNGSLGVAMNTSEDFHKLPRARLDLWHFVRPQATPWTARLPYWEGGSQFKVTVREFPAHRAWAVVILNDTKKPLMERLRIADWIGRPSAHLFAWGPEGAQALGAATEWIAEVAGHRATLLYVSADGTPPPTGLTLGGWLPPVAAHAAI